jgi:ATP/ADP translocase
MPLSGKVKKTVKTFLDVVIERVGDATAGFIILLALSFTRGYYIYVQFACVALIVLWMLIVALLRTRDLEPLNAELKSQGLAPPDGEAVDKQFKHDQMTQES